VGLIDEHVSPAPLILLQLILFRLPFLFSSLAPLFVVTTDGMIDAVWLRRNFCNTALARSKRNKEG